ncbi:hypothetical protein CCR75_003751 [Bremia lactucae]|uniref:RxLR effector protein n=1 Tax=Bremia lactucae TaxID=4779 RepID=A0A976FLB8_BRELC|nr:hypothetical protein CCR75_003751 [Bremia lactucae]
MRFVLVIFMTAATICASRETISVEKDGEHDKLLVITSTTRYLKEDYGAVSNSRLLRVSVGSNQSGTMQDEADIGEDSYMDTVYFKLWRLIGKTPGEVYTDSFGTMDPASAAQNPSYNRYIRYKRYYNNHH